jgi:hypothetical protein
LANTIQVKRRIGGGGSPAVGGSLEGEIALAFPAGQTPELWAFANNVWNRVNPPAGAITQQAVDLNNPGGGTIGAAAAAWITANAAFTGDIVLGTYGTPAQAYILTTPASPNLDGSWTSLGGAVSFADATEIHAGSDTTKAINSAILRGEALKAPSTTGGAADEDRLIRLDANGKIAAAFLPASALTQLGAKNVVAPIGTYTPVQGDSFFVSAAGTVDASWTGIGGQTVETGDMVIYDGTNFHVVPNETDLNAYLALAGGSMSDGASITFDTTTAAGTAGGAATQVSLDGAGSSIDGFVIDCGGF